MDWFERLSGFRETRHDETRAKSPFEDADSLRSSTARAVGAFGNDEAWILSAMRRAFTLASALALEARIVSFGAPSRAALDLAKSFG